METFAPDTLNQTPSIPLDTLGEVEGAKITAPVNRTTPPVVSDNVSSGDGNSLADNGILPQQSPFDLLSFDDNAASGGGSPVAGNNTASAGDLFITGDNLSSGNNELPLPFPFTNSNLYYSDGDTPSTNGNATIGNGNWHFGSGNATIGNGNWYLANDNLITDDGNASSGSDDLITGSPLDQGDSTSLDNKIIIGNDDWVIVADRDAITGGSDISNDQLMANINALIYQVGLDFVGLLGGSMTFDQPMSTQGTDTNDSNALNSIGNSDEFLASLTGIQANPTGI